MLVSGSSSAPAIPDIAVTGNGSFGSTVVGTTDSEIFAVEATDADIVITAINLPSGFSHNAVLPWTIEAGTSENFTITSLATAFGTFSGNVELTSNDPDENPYTFAISSTVTPITANLVSWYDASDAATLFEDSAGTTPAADNADVIGRWADKSGNNYHITQGTTADKPTLRTAVQNSKNVVRADGSTDFLSNTSYPDFGDVYTVYVVAKNTTGGDTTQGLLEVSTSAPGSRSGFVLEHTTVAQGVGRDATVARLATTALDLRDSVFRIHKFVNIGTQLQYTINASAATTVAYTAPNPNTLAHIYVFANLGGGRHLGDIAEILIYSTNHDASQQAATLAALNTKWAVY